MRRRVLPAPLVLSLAATGCIDTLDQEQSTLGERTRDCVVPLPEGVEELGAPVSLEYPGKSLWLWSNAAAFVDQASALCSDGPDLFRDGDGAPTPLFALDSDELASNVARDDGRRLELVAVGGFSHEDTGYVFYEHRLQGPGFFDSELLGTGLCVLDPGEERCERLRRNASSVLWGPEQRFLNSGGVVVSERALVFGCRRVADFLRVCTMTGAPLDALTDPTSYQPYDYFHGWVDDPLAASVVIEELGSVTVSLARDGYLATTLDPFDGHVYVSLSEDLLSRQFSRRLDVFATPLPESGLAIGGREHSGLRDDPNELHVSYVTDRPGAAGLHLASFRFFGKFGGHFQ
jgi:hypothetical protein